MASKLTWLHISDIHFSPSTNWRDIPARSKLIRFLKDGFAKSVLPKPDLIFCTGDVAFGELRTAPLVQQYQYAKGFFEELLGVCGLSKDRLFVVPGNHDINRDSLNEGAQKDFIRSASESSKHETRINQQFESRNLEHTDAFRRLSDFDEFIKSFLPALHDQEGRCCFFKRIDVNGIDIGIAGLNSAWSCAGPHDDRHLWLAAQWQFNQAEQVTADAILRIGLMHHPVDWLNQTELNVATHRIAGNFDFWLHGHTHNPWVSPTQNCNTVAAGAVNAGSDEEFGVNIVTLNLDNLAAKARLFAYTATDNAWMPKDVPGQTNQGIWSFKFRTNPSAPSTDSAAVAQPKAKDVETGTNDPTFGNASPVAKGNTKPPHSAQHPKLYGRGKLLESLTRDFEKTGCLLLFGMRGNGKSSLIDALIDQEPWVSWDPEIRIVASVVREPADFFRAIAKALGINDECPLPPTGTLQEQIDGLSRRLGRLRRTIVWVDQAHLWFDRNSWRNPHLGVLVTALQRVTGKQWGWIFELRERPPQGLFTAGIAAEVAGLDRESLGEWLANSAPNAENADWRISGNNLRALYQWLGGGQGHQAHPFATRLLIDVALGLGVSPMEVRQRFLKQAEDQVEQFLLADLFNNVLSDSEQKLLLALSLYRGAIPHDHIEPLANHLDVANAWAGLDQRCLLPSDSRQERFYLHGFFSAWLRQKMGYLSDDGSDADETAHQEVAHPVAKDLHQAIGECWLEQVRGRQFVSAVNIERALEAFHHLVAAGELWSVREIAIDLIAGHRDGALDRLWTICRGLHKEKKGDDLLERVLRYILQISPDDPKALRFLGETLRRARGRNDREALACFQQAFSVQPTYAPNLANLGVSLLSQGPESASEYLRLVDQARKEHPCAVNHYVVAVELDCLDLVSPDTAAASRKRLELINSGSRHAAFFGAEASWELENGNPVEALRILDLAEERRCGDEVTTSIRATVFEKLGRGADASRLRQEMIDRGTRSPAIYSAEIAYKIGKNRLNQALKLVEQAEKSGCISEYIVSARAHVLGQMGQGAEASRFRMKAIDGNSRDVVIFHDEATWQLKQGSPDVAARLLDRVDGLGVATEYTLSVRASVLEASGRGEDASKLRTERINANSRNPAFYTAEAKWLLEEGMAERALQMLDVLDERGLGNEFGKGLRASALDKAGRAEEAMRIRQRMIERGSIYLPVFVVEAESQLARENFDEVIQIADVAKQRGIENAQLAALRARALAFKLRK